MMVNFNKLEDSIINGGAEDRYEPYSFLTFIRYYHSNSNIDELYRSYITSWSSSKNIKKQSDGDIIKQQYIQLFKEIALDFTTASEKRYLNNLDFSNNNDISLAIPLYTRKIREICTFYRDNRSAYKTKLASKQYKGSNLSIEQAAFEAVINFIQSDPILRSKYQDTIDNISDKLNISITQFIDFDGDYFDEGNIIDIDVFVNNDNILNDAIKASSSVVGELDFVSFEIDTNELLDYPSKLSQVINLKEDVSEYIDIHKQYYQKFISGNVLIIKSDSECNVTEVNAINGGEGDSSTNPNIAYKSGRDIIPITNIGEFFAPGRRGTMIIKGGKEFYVDIDNIEPDMYYIIPDKSEDSSIINYPIEYIVNPDDYSQLSIGSSRTTNKPVIRKDNKIKPFKFKLNDWAEYIKDGGIISHHSVDILGNNFAIFKGGDTNINKDSINIQLEADRVTIEGNTFDGHQFIDLRDGPGGFDYDIVEADYYGSYRSGITLRTVIDGASPSLDIDEDNNIFEVLRFGDIDQQDVTINSSVVIYDCLSFVGADGSTITDDDLDLHIACLEGDGSPAGDGFNDDTLIDLNVDCSSFNIAELANNIILNQFGEFVVLEPTFDVYDNKPVNKIDEDNNQTLLQSSKNFSKHYSWNIINDDFADRTLIVSQRGVIMDWIDFISTVDDVNYAQYSKPSSINAYGKTLVVDSFNRLYVILQYNEDGSIKSGIPYAPLRDLDVNILTNIFKDDDGNIITDIDGNIITGETILQGDLVDSPTPFTNSALLEDKLKINNYTNELYNSENEYIMSAYFVGDEDFTIIVSAFHANEGELKINARLDVEDSGIMDGVDSYTITDAKITYNKASKLYAIVWVGRYVLDTSESEVRISKLVFSIEDIPEDLYKSGIIDPIEFVDIWQKVENNQTTNTSTI